MSVSEFTQKVCRELCADKAIVMETERLLRKAENMRANGGKLTESQKQQDEYERKEANRLFDIYAGIDS